MRTISVTEHQAIPREQLGRAACRHLQRFDEQWAATAGKTIFDWSRRRSFKARNWVGVVQVPGVTIEILPKIEGLRGDEARRNLVYMLACCGKLPIRERGLAAMDVDRLPILDTLIAIFTRRLLTELGRGVERGYTGREENAGFVRGKLLLGEHLRRNAIRHDRVYVRYSEFHANTVLNQILKRTCRVLLTSVRGSAAGRDLRVAIHSFDDVSDIAVCAHHFDRVHLTRNSERFATLLDFCRIILLEGSPTLRAGDRPSFSLLFPMERVFEQFITRFIRRHAAHFGIAASDVHAQARSQRHWLLRDAAGAGRFRLKPDLLVGSREQPRLILDAKWKRLNRDDSRPGRISQPDVYQLHAYATRYRCQDNILLFPRVPGAVSHTYVLDGDPLGRRIRVAFVDLARDLRRDHTELLDELRGILLTPEPHTAPTPDRDPSA